METIAEQPEQIKKLLHSSHNLKNNWKAEMLRQLGPHLGIRIEVKPVRSDLFSGRYGPVKGYWAAA